MIPFQYLRLMIIGLLQAVVLGSCNKAKPPPPQVEIHHHELLILLPSPKEDRS